MAWIRLDDDYIAHPKFAALSDRAFRLWHEGMAYCRKLLTDGLIPRAALKAFRYATRGAVTELTTSIAPDVAPLWEANEDGFLVHDYLIWNRSKEQEIKEREEAKERAQLSRSNHARAPGRAVHVRKRERDLDLEFQEGKSVVDKPITSLQPNDVAQKAGYLLQRYADLFTKHRNGAKLLLIGNSLEFEAACSLVRVWDLPRLEKLAVVVLTTDDPFISGTDRSFRIFGMKASWADDRLKVWELEHGEVEA